MTTRISRVLLAFGILAGTTVAFSPGASAQPVTWNFSQTHVPAAQAAGHYGRGVRVAILDTWVDRTHPEFGGRVLEGADCVGGTCTAGVAPQDQCEPHGTHVAGIITSTDYGVAPQAQVLPVRVLSWKNNACTADSGDVARGVTWAADHGAQIINISLGTAVATGSVADVTAAVEAASARGILVVAAAGNEQAPVGNAYGQDAVVVAATGPSGQLASYSQRGNGVDLAAPGGDPVGDNCTVSTCVVSTWSNHRIAAFAGTSMAAPHVAGIAALLWGQNPNRSRQDVVNHLFASAHALAEAGHGLVDAQRALGATGNPTPSSTATATATPSSTATPAGTGTGAVQTTKPKATSSASPSAHPIRVSQSLGQGSELVPPTASPVTIASGQPTTAKSRTVQISAAAGILALVAISQASVYGARRRAAAHHRVQAEADALHRRLTDR